MCTRLTCEYLVDAYSRCEEERLEYIRRYRTDPEETDENPDYLDHRALPSSFYGSKAWSAERCADCHALAKEFGIGSFFITMTANPEWPEIRAQLEPWEQPMNCPGIVSRVFRLKLRQLMNRLKQTFPVSHLIHRAPYKTNLKKDSPLCNSSNRVSETRTTSCSHHHSYRAGTTVGGD